MATPLPSMLAAWLMEVAVVRWSGGNHWLEMRGGAAMIVTPLTPFRMAQAWQLYIVKVSLTNNLTSIYVTCATCVTCYLRRNKSLLLMR